MANTLLTISDITRECLRVWKNTNSFIMSIDRQYDSSFAVQGAKIGDSLRIRLPNDYVVRRGAAIQLQNTTERNITLTVADQRGVDVAFSTVERALSLDDWSIRHGMPMMNNLAGDIALAVMEGSEDGGISNFVSLLDGSGDITTPSAETWLLAGAKLDELGCPRSDRHMVIDPLTQARAIASLSGLFNPTGIISDQYRTGTIQTGLGFDWMADQTVLVHDTAGYSGTKTVNGADQTGTVITVNAITGGLNAGDIITFAGVNLVNRTTKQAKGELAQFVVVADVASGGTSITIYPAIIPPDSLGNPVQYQTVDASPADAATIVVVSKTAESYRKNFAFHREAVTLTTADLEIPGGVHEAHRETYDSLSMRMVTFYDGNTDKMITRSDILFGFLWMRPEWCCVVADAV